VWCRDAKFRPPPQQYADQKRLNLVKFWSNDYQIWPKLVYKSNLVGVVYF
jgi:hypothetical protein